MKKVLSMIACLSLVVSMFVGMTANAELNYGTPKAIATFAGFVDGNLEPIADTATHAGDAYAVIQISYTGLENLAVYSSTGIGVNKKENVTGVAAIGIETTLANNDAHANIGNASEDDDSTGWGLSCGFFNEGALIKCGGNASKYNGYLTDASGDVIKMYVQVVDTEAANTFKLDVAEFTIKSIVDSKEVADNSGTISLATEGCTIPAFNQPATESKVATVATWAFDGGMLIIGKLDGEFEVGTYGVEVDGLVLGDESSYAGVGPQFPTRKPASDAGYYGVQFTGADAATYTVRAYAGTDKGADATVTVAE